MQGFGIGHTSDRLVDEKQFRLLCQQHADFQPLLLAMRQAAGHARTHVFEPCRVQDVIDTILLRRGIFPHQCRSYTPVVFQCQHQIVLD